MKGSRVRCPSAAPFSFKPGVNTPLRKDQAKAFVKGLPEQPLEKGMENAKRLRGVQVEHEKLKSTKRTLEKGNESRLATALLSLWAHGKISAITCRWLAECASLDGCTHPEICDIARLGCHGKYEGNVHRDALTRFVKDVNVPEPLQVSVRCLGPKNLQKGEEEAATFLPHMVFSKLATLPNFNQLFPTAMLEQFWQTLEKSGDPALKDPQLEKAYYTTFCTW